MQSVESRIHSHDWFMMCSAVIMDSGRLFRRPEFGLRGEAGSAPE
jgi:hypothetical protein